jgi:ADP-ribose pyrophosphatase
MASAKQPRITARSLIHRAKKFDLELLTLKSTRGKEYQREVVRHPGAVVIVPILEKAGRRHLVLIRVFRNALAHPTLECCAGTIERARVDPKARRGSKARGFRPGESPRTCASRELVEETGYKAAKFTHLGWYYTTPGLTDEKMYAFAATNLTHVGQDLEEDESIQVELIPAAKAVGLITSGRIRDAKSMLAILLAHRAGYL